MKFVKIKGYPEWFHLAEAVPDFKFTMKMQKRLISAVWQQHRQFIGTAVRTPLVYRLDQGPILIREVGSWMLLRGQEITEVREENDFPKEPAEIVICENDLYPEPFWLEYLQNRFPGRSISTLSFFGSRLDIKERLAEGEVITFSTTFSSFDWFFELMRHAEGKQIIGYSHDPSKWDLIDRSKIETVHELPISH